MNLDAAESVARIGRLYPALILHGGTAESRRQAAVRLARVLLCEVAPDERPCERCRHCQRITWPDGSGERFHPDFQVLRVYRMTHSYCEGRGRQSGAVYGTAWEWEAWSPQMPQTASGGSLVVEPQTSQT